MAEDKRLEQPLSAAELTRFEVILNGDRGMLPHPQGEYVRYADVLAMLTPPADAAVREAVEYLWSCLSIPATESATSDRHLRTLLSYVRAAQTPRPTCDEFAEWCGNCAFGKSEAACDATATGHDDFNGVKCSGWSPRLTGERLEFMKRLRRTLCVRGLYQSVLDVDATFPELGEG